MPTACRFESSDALQQRTAGRAARCDCQSASRRWIFSSGFSAPISASRFISSLRSSGTRSARSSTLVNGRSPARIAPRRLFAQSAA